MNLESWAQVSGNLIFSFVSFFILFFFFLSTIFPTVLLVFHDYFLALNNKPSPACHNRCVCVVVKRETVTPDAGGLQTNQDILLIGDNTVGANVLQTILIYGEM